MCKPKRFLVPKLFSKDFKRCSANFLKDIFQTIILSGSNRPVFLNLSYVLKHFTSCCCRLNSICSLFYIPFQLTTDLEKKLARNNPSNIVNLVLKIVFFLNNSWNAWWQVGKPILIKGSHVKLVNIKSVITFLQDCRISDVDLFSFDVGNHFDIPVSRNSFNPFYLFLLNT